jgi:inhibitor of KinA sporulation pathway (predicted exonuclease)
LKLVHQFLEANGVLSTEFVFLSCGDFDGNQMRREAINKKLEVPNYLKRWINVKKVFPLHLFDKNAEEKKIEFVRDVQRPSVKGMPHMLELCNLELVGKHHSGIDDANNIARVVVECLKKGFNFHQGMVLSHPFVINK